MTRHMESRLKIDPFLELTQRHGLVNAALPQVAVLTLGLNVGTGGEWLIKTGDWVEEEQIIGQGPQGRVFSPIPGRVVKVTSMVLPDGTESTVAAIALEGAFKRTGKSVNPQPWEEWNSTRLFEMLEYYNFLATSSALEPPFHLDPRARIKKVIVNLLQPEPYQTNWYHLCLYEDQNIVTGIKILKKLYSPEVIEFAVHKRPKDYAARVISKFGSGTYTVTWHDAEYPAAHSKLLSNSETSLVIDADSLVALSLLARYSRPQVESFVTVSGSGVAQPKVYRVKVGTLVSNLLEECGVSSSGEHSVIWGGPFSGYRLQTDTMITITTRSILVLNPHETRIAEQQPCIRCSACVDSCPVGINPIRLFEGLEVKDGFQELRPELQRCLECGICSSVCPSRIPLLQRFRQERRNR